MAAIVLATVVFISCADDQDPTTTSPDSPAVKTNDTGATAAIAGSNQEYEPKDLDTSHIPILALLNSDATRFPETMRFILRLQPADTTEAALTARGMRAWYGVKLTTPFNQRNKERLNFHVHGYLTYYDMAANDPPVRHTVFLKWHGNGANVDSVTVWLNPPNVMRPVPGVLDRVVSDPPRPLGPPPPPME